MAIYSCNLKSIGRTTHREGTAGAHIRYIARPEAEPVVLAARMPNDADQARNWMDRAERASRKNARLLDKIRIALPRELNETQRVELVRDFMKDLTGDGRVPWFAGIHQKGEDAHNPHVHIAVHDRDTETGKRVLRLSDSTRDRVKAGLPGPKAVEWIRERWESVCNRALKRAGIDERIDRRTLKAQGIDREPGIHVGPRASHIYGHVKRPESRGRINGCGRVIDYPLIDKGKTRREFNAQIVDLNLERAARSDNPERAAWAAFEKDQLAKDRVLEERLAKERRTRTAQLRNIGNLYKGEAVKIRAGFRLNQRAVRLEIKSRFARLRDDMRDRHRREREALKTRQGKFYRRLLKTIDFTGTTKRGQKEARKALSETHRKQRQALSEKYLDVQQARFQAIRQRHDKQRTRLDDKRTKHLTELQDSHKSADRSADRERQLREVDREQARKITKRKIRDWKRKRQTPTPPQQGGSGGRSGRDDGQSREESGAKDALARAAKRAQEMQEQQQREGKERKNGKDGGRNRS